MSDPKMSFRPQNDVQRRLLVARAEAVLREDGLDPVAASLLNSLLAPAVAAWAALDRGAEAADLDEQRLAAAEDAADAAWDAALSTLAWSLRGTDGGPVSLGAVAGMGLREAQRLPPARELELVAEIEAGLTRGGVAHDAAALTALKAATEALRAATTARDAARSGRVSTNMQRAQAAAELDRAAASAARALRVALGDATARALLPVF